MILTRGQYINIYSQMFSFVQGYKSLQRKITALDLNVIHMQLFQTK